MKHPISWDGVDLWAWHTIMWGVWNARLFIGSPLHEFVFNTTRDKNKGSPRTDYYVLSYMITQCDKRGSVGEWACSHMCPVFSATCIIIIAKTSDHMIISVILWAAAEATNPMIQYQFDRDCSCSLPKTICTTGWFWNSLMRSESWLLAFAIGGMRVEGKLDHFSA